MPRAACNFVDGCLSRVSGGQRRCYPLDATLVHRLPIIIIIVAVPGPTREAKRSFEAHRRLSRFMSFVEDVLAQDGHAIIL
jgi:hypothetical protein